MFFHFFTFSLSFLKEKSMNNSSSDATFRIKLFELKLRYHELKNATILIDMSKFAILAPKDLWRKHFSAYHKLPPENFDSNSDLSEALTLSYLVINPKYQLVHYLG